MAYREVTMIEVKEVLRQWLSGAAKRAIARRVGLDRNTVRRYLEPEFDRSSYLFGTHPEEFRGVTGLRSPKYLVHGFTHSA